MPYNNFILWSNLYDANKTNMNSNLAYLLLGGMNVGLQNWEYYGIKWYKSIALVQFNAFWFWPIGCITHTRILYVWKTDIHMYRKVELRMLTLKFVLQHLAFPCSGSHLFGAGGRCNCSWKLIWSINKWNIVWFFGWYLIFWFGPLAACWTRFWRTMWFGMQNHRTSLSRGNNLFTFLLHYLFFLIRKLRLNFMNLGGVWDWLI